MNDKKKPKNGEREKKQRLLKSPTFSPAGFLVWAGAIALVYIVCQVLGLREYASVISGTSPTGDMTDTFSLATGMFYVLIHFGFVLGAPILIAGSGIMAVLCRFSKINS